MASQPCNNQQKKIHLILVLFLLGLICTISLLAVVPPISRDALTHHLFVPRLFLEHGGIYEIPSIPFSYYPMNLDLLYMIPLYFGNDIIPKYIHFLFALLTTWLIYNYLKNRISQTYGLIGSLVFLSIPIIVKLSITVYVDLGLMFFTTASLLLLFRWLDSNHKKHYLFLAGICCGLAAGTKYNGLITIFLLTLFVPVLYMRSQNRLKGSNTKAVGFSLLFGLATLLAFSPWLIKNYAWTENPIYPLYDSLFQKISKKEVIQEYSEKKNPTNKINQVTFRGNNVFVNRKILYHETWWQALLLPIRFFFEGQDDNPRYFDGKLNPFLFILPFFAFLKKPTTSQVKLEKLTLLAFVVLYFFFTFFQGTLRIRYIVSIIPSLVLLSIFGLQNIISAVAQINFTRMQRLGQLLSISILVGIFAYNGLYIITQFQIIQPLPYLFKKIDREQYITKFRPEYPAIQFANSYLTPGSKVLCIFLGNRGYYMDFQPIFDRPSHRGFLTDLLQSPVQKKNLRNALLDQNITCILLRDDLTQGWLQRLKATKRKEIISFFQKDTKKIFYSGGYSLFSINQNNQNNSESESS